MCHGPARPAVKTVYGSSVLERTRELRPPARCARPELHSVSPCFMGVCWLAEHCPASRQMAAGVVRGYGIMFVVVMFNLMTNLVAGVSGSIAWWIILWKGVGRSRGMNNKLWRSGLTGVRCLAVLSWCRDESCRCAATRRHTSRTGADLISEYLEKTGCFIVYLKNWWRVFQCTVNWARARPGTALIAGGVPRSSSFYAARVWECAAAGVGGSVLQTDGAADVAFHLW